MSRSWTDIDEFIKDRVRLDEQDWRLWPENYLARHSLNNPINKIPEHHRPWRSVWYYGYSLHTGLKVLITTPEEACQLADLCGPDNYIIVPKDVAYDGAFLTKDGKYLK